VGIAEYGGGLGDCPPFLHDYDFGRNSDLRAERGEAMTDKELLAVLDLPEEEHLMAVAKLAWRSRKKSSILADFHREYKGGYMDTSLADLAFRLRDEAVSDLPERNAAEKWESALKAVCKHIGIYLPIDEWFVDHAQPIHWIIAALIAKETKT
jgi:hypothetical protein